MKLGLDYWRTDTEDAAVIFFFFRDLYFIESFAKTLNIISPNEIKQLLYYVLTTSSQQTIQQGVDIEQR